MDTMITSAIDVGFVWTLELLVGMDADEVAVSYRVIKDGAVNTTVDIPMLLSVNVNIAVRRKGSASVSEKLSST